MKESAGIKKPKGTAARVSAKKAASYLHSMQSQSLPASSSSSKPKQSTPTRAAPKWNSKHFKLFVGNLGPDGNDELLRTSFEKYKSMSQIYVPIDKKTGLNKGFGFVAFAKSEDYLHAFQEMNGKYIGQRPVQLKRAK
ncbi:putative RNA-binding protein C22E12.02 [Candida viswanathii]|uniref:Putative RNA-binding protein C22E12.02 n=1 Tax=Candida viswanathii TaxID=5486 RepID=A0A367XU28_9ASCO|nr:putative RNA-binding protein C22E12.02 [Candida viswanathii]